MVMMTRVVTSASRAGAMASVATMKPISAVAATAPTTASGNGAPSEARNAAIMPPSMMNSPWAKLMTPEAL